jgi:xylan 1,4-beta-xylosidase
MILAARHSCQILLLLSVAIPLPAQRPIVVRVNASVSQGAFKPIWKYFGYDEPNYTYAEHGRKLIGEISSLGSWPAYIRTHNLLTTGDGTPALKWGSTNAYTEDASGHPVYDWTIVDHIFDTYLAAGSKPFVEIGFMPKALSVHPDPYRHNWPEGTLWTGWSYPPKDYSKWGELIYQWVLHSLQKYGRAEVASWYWEVWNEPDIGYWQGTPEEYDKLYDYAAEAVKRALPSARVGGPATTDPSNPKAARFLDDFLTHCERGANEVSGKQGSPLDFISFHVKGRTTLEDGRPEMSAGHQLLNVSKGFEIVRQHRGLSKLPIILSESDPEGCAACVATKYPQNEYRNTAQYASYEAEVLQHALDLAARDQVNLAGLVTWAFEFEDQPYFVGFRTLATNGIDKPVLNVFRMFGLMTGERVAAESTGALETGSVIESSVRKRQEVSALATRDGHKVTVLIWNYTDDSAPRPASPVQLKVEGLPETRGHLQVDHYRIDEDRSNSFAAWKAMGSPQQPTAEQYARLEAAGRLQRLEAPQQTAASAGKLELSLSLPSQAVSLIELSW